VRAISALSGYGAEAPQYSDLLGRRYSSTIFAALRCPSLLRCYVLRTPFYERSTQLRCSAVRLIAIWRCLYSCHFSDLEIEDKCSSAL